MKKKYKQEIIEISEIEKIKKGKKEEIIAFLDKYFSVELDEKLKKGEVLKIFEEKFEEGLEQSKVIKNEDNYVLNYDFERFEEKQKPLDGEDFGEELDRETEELTQLSKEEKDELYSHCGYLGELDSETQRRYFYKMKNQEGIRKINTIASVLDIVFLALALVISITVVSIIFCNYDFKINEYYNRSDFVGHIGLFALQMQLAMALTIYGIGKLVLLATLSLRGLRLSFFNEKGYFGILGGFILVFLALYVCSICFDFIQGNKSGNEGTINHYMTYYEGSFGNLFDFVGNLGFILGISSYQKRSIFGIFAKAKDPICLKSYKTYIFEKQIKNKELFSKGVSLFSKGDII